MPVPKRLAPGRFHHFLHSGGMLMAARQPEPDPEVLTVSEVTRQIKDSLEGNFPDTWVQGEISNLKRATSGHLYFTLKDAGAQLGAILWRSGAARRSPARRRY